MTLEQMKLLYAASLQAGTQEKFTPLLFDWATQADAEIKRLRTLLEAASGR